MLRSINGENDQMSSLSRAMVRSCPARNPQSTPNGSAAHSWCSTAGAAISRPPKEPAQRSQQKRRLKAQIPSQKAGNGKADPDADCDRQRKPQHQINFLPEGPFFAKQQRLELFGADQSAGNNRGHAQLEHQMDQYEPRFHEIQVRPKAPKIRR